MKKLIYGIGINDADYPANPRVNGKQVRCPFYERWTSMLRRCYSAAAQARNPTYIGCSVTPEWLTFSNFKSWMGQQDWQGKQLDKDLLVRDNKVYSPATCVFIDSITNSFTNENVARRGEWPIGVNFHKHEKKFMATCSNPFSKKLEHLGCFTCPEQAHQAWRKRKHELACQLADMQTDSRVADALRKRFAN